MRQGEIREQGASDRGLRCAARRIHAGAAGRASAHRPDPGPQAGRRRADRARGAGAGEELRRRSGGQGRELQAGEGPHARSGGRIGLGQDDAGPPGDAPARALGRRAALPRERCACGAAACVQAQGADRVPEPLRFAQPALQHRRDPDRADAPARHRRGRGGAPGARRGAAGESRAAAKAPCPGIRTSSPAASASASPSRARSACSPSC